MYVRVRRPRRMSGFWSDLVGGIFRSDPARRQARQQQEQQARQIGVTRECVRVRDARWNAGLLMVDFPTSAKGSGPGGLDPTCTANRVGYRPGDAMYPSAPVLQISDGGAVGPHSGSAYTIDQRRRWDRWLVDNGYPPSGLLPAGILPAPAGTEITATPATLLPAQDPPPADSSPVLSSILPAQFSLANIPTWALVGGGVLGLFSLAIALRDS